MKKVTRDNKTFKIVPENKTVYGTGKKKDLSYEICSTFTKYEHEVLPSDLYIVPTSNIYSKAVCSEGDHFDEKIGIDISSAKLDLKNHEYAARKYDWVIKTMISAIKKLEDLSERHKKKAKAIRNDLERYYGEGEYLK